MRRSKGIMINKLLVVILGLLFTVLTMLALSRTIADTVGLTAQMRLEFDMNDLVNNIDMVSAFDEKVTINDSELTPESTILFKDNMIEAALDEDLEDVPIGGLFSYFTFHTSSIDEREYDTGDSPEFIDIQSSWYMGRTRIGDEVGSVAFFSGLESEHPSVDWGVEYEDVDEEYVIDPDDDVPDDIIDELEDLEDPDEEDPEFIFHTTSEQNLRYQDEYDVADIVEACVDSSFYDRDPHDPYNVETIAIDPGHGGDDPGAVNHGMTEADIVLDISKRVGSKLANDYQVVMTRNDDSSVGLSERANIANNYNSDLFVSVHVNAADEAAKGSEVFYPSVGGEREEHSVAFSQLILDNFLEKLDTSDRGIKSDTETQYESLTVLRETQMPAVLVEPVFLSHPDEGKRLEESSFREKIADSIVEGIQEFDDMHSEEEVKEIDDCEDEEETRETGEQIGDELYSLITNCVLGATEEQYYNNAPTGDDPGHDIVDDLPDIVDIVADEIVETCSITDGFDIAIENLRDVVLSYNIEQTPHFRNVDRLHLVEPFSVEAAVNRALNNLITVAVNYEENKNKFSRFSDMYYVTSGNIYDIHGGYCSIDDIYYRDCHNIDIPYRTFDIEDDLYFDIEKSPGYYYTTFEEATMDMYVEEGDPIEIGSGYAILYDNIADVEQYLDTVEEDYAIVRVDIPENVYQVVKFEPVEVDKYIAFIDKIHDYERV